MDTNRGTTRQIVFFLTIHAVMTAAVFALMLSGGGDSMPLVMLMMWTPAFAAFVTLAVYREPLSSLGWRPGKIRYLLESYTLPIVVAIAAYGLVWMTGYADFFLDEVISYRWARMLGFELPVHPAVGIGSKMLWGFLLFIFFVVGEEIGWSGFLVPKLLKVTSIPVTSLIVGLYWSLWHMPAFFVGLYGNGAPLWIAIPGVTVVFMAASMMRTVLVSRSGSLWTGTLLHLSHNTVLMGIFFDLTRKTDSAKILVSESGLITGLVYAVFAIVYWKWSVNTEGGIEPGIGANQPR